MARVTAGAGPRRLARRRARLGAAGVAAGVALVVWGLWWSSTGLAVGGVMLAGAARWWGGRAAGRARAGSDGEVEVAGCLRGVGAEAVIFGVRLPGGGDADVVVLGPMVAVVEVKRAVGRVRCLEDGAVAVDGRRLPGRAVRQAVAAAAAVRSRLAGVDHVDAVLCVTGMQQRPRRVAAGRGEVVVCSARHLRRTLRRLPVRLGRGEGRTLGRELARS